MTAEKLLFRASFPLSEVINLELALADLTQIEKRLEKLKKGECLAVAFLRCPEEKAKLLVCLHTAQRLCHDLFV